MGKFVVKEVKTGFKFDLKAGNGEVIATSEVYTAEQSCLNGIESVRKNAVDAKLEDQTVENFETVTNPKFEVYVDKAGEFRFRLKARNGEIIAISEGYKAKASALNGIAFSVANVFLQSTLNTFGDIAISGYAISANLIYLIAQPSAAFYSACVSFAGQCYGAKRYKRIDKLLISSIAGGYICIIALCAVLTSAPNSVSSPLGKSCSIIRASLTSSATACR